MKYGPKELKTIGEALFGPSHWQAGLTKALGLNDTRRIRHWITGSRPIPPGIWCDIKTMLLERKKNIEDILGEIMTHTELEQEALSLFEKFPECRATCFPAVNEKEGVADLWHTNNRPLPRGWTWVRHHGPAAELTSECPLCQHSESDVD